eukprot:GFYU01013083.1.p1 GENE.GFYU01013083.1~~GFYU01013083.1.p1  ORF type:complete len:210 (-),score=28.82 GFYU01013083.1:412-1041(-)
MGRGNYSEMASNNGTSFAQGMTKEDSSLDDIHIRDPESGAIDFQEAVARERFPYCVVSTPLPCITWFLPFVVHMGITDSQGVIHDFGGPYFVSVDNMTFSKVTRYYRLDPKKIPGATMEEKEKEWDRCVYAGSDVFRKRMHNICCNNCHHHTAYCMNMVKYDNRNSWTQWELGARMFLLGTFVSPSRALFQVGPFLGVMAFILIFVFLT